MPRRARTWRGIGAPRWATSCNGRRYTGGMTESGKVTAWVAVKVELESCELWPDDLPCTEACTYEHEHEYLGECGEGCAEDCDLDHYYTGRCDAPRRCGEPSY